MTTTPAHRADGNHTDGNHTDAPPSRCEAMDHIDGGYRTSYEPGIRGSTSVGSR